MFDGRIAKKSKLATGTFVSVGLVRATVIAAGDRSVQRLAVACIDRDPIGCLRTAPSPTVH